jgi:hypothetical protein
LILADAATPTAGTSNSAPSAIETAVSQIRTLELDDREAKLLVSLLMNTLYQNRNSSLNPDQKGGDSELRDFLRLANGWKEYALTPRDKRKPNDDGGVCDQIAAAACTIWNRLHPDKPCYLVNLPETGSGLGTQHWYLAIKNSDGTITFLDSEFTQSIEPNGVAVAKRGNPQLFVPIARSNADGDAQLIAAPPSELMDFITAMSEPNSEEAELFRGLLSAGHATYSLQSGSVTVGGGQGKLSEVNEGLNVSGIYASWAFRKKPSNNARVTIFHTLAREAGESVWQSAGVSGVKLATEKRLLLLPLAKGFEFELKAGGEAAYGVMSRITGSDATNTGQGEHPGLGVTAGGKLFAQGSLQGEKTTSSGANFAGTVNFRVEGVPGINIARLHGIDVLPYPAIHDLPSLKQAVLGFPNEKTVEVTGAVSSPRGSRFELRAKGMKGPLGGQARVQVDYTGPKGTILGGSFERKSDFFSVPGTYLGASVGRKMTSCTLSLTGTCGPNGWSFGGSARVSLSGTPEKTRAVPWSLRTTP